MALRVCGRVTNDPRHSALKRTGIRHQKPRRGAIQEPRASPWGDRLPGSARGPRAHLHKRSTPSSAPLAPDSARGPRALPGLPAHSARCAGLLNGAPSRLIPYLLLGRTHGKIGPERCATGDQSKGSESLRFGPLSLIFQADKSMMLPLPSEEKP